MHVLNVTFKGNDSMSMRHASWMPCDTRLYCIRNHEDVALHCIIIIDVDWTKATPVARDLLCLDKTCESLAVEAGH